MKLKELSTKPELIKITLDDEEIREDYGDALEFWIYDKQPMTKFVKFMSADSADPAELIDFCTALILDESGDAVIGPGEVLPTKVMIKAVNEVVTRLGK